MKHPSTLLREQRIWEAPQDFAIFDAALRDYLIETRLRHNGGHVLHKVDLVFPANLRQTVIRHRQDFCAWLKRNGMPDCRIAVSGQRQDVLVALSFMIHSEYICGN
jgi:hypothetical protein